MKNGRMSLFCGVLALTMAIVFLCAGAQAEEMKTAQLTQVNNVNGIIAQKNSSNLLVNFFPNMTPSMCRIISNTDQKKDYFIPIGNLAEWQSFLNNKPDNFVVSECVGSCGPANGKSFANIEAIETLSGDNLCISGLPSKISGSGPWTWECAGIDGASGATCVAHINCANYAPEKIVKNDACPAGFSGAVVYQKSYYCPLNHEPGVWEPPKVMSVDCKYKGDNAATVCENKDCKIKSISEDKDGLYILTLSAGAVNAVSGELTLLKSDSKPSFEAFSKAVEAGLKKFTSDPSKWRDVPKGVEYGEYAPEKEDKP